MKSFTYYAFISYSHRDQKIAKKLQRWLQSYHLPSKITNIHPEFPKKLSPIFIDEANLIAPGKSLQQALQDNLDESNYLIVVCSPESAKSQYVNEEVEYFIRIGRKNYVIPLIIDGEPHSYDSSKECFPPALLNLSRNEELLGHNFNELGKRIAFLKVIATMLNLKYEYIILADEWKRKKKAMVFTSISAILTFIIGVLIWYNIPHYRYYSSYVYRWEKPIGLFEVSSSVRKKMNYTYRFTILKGNVQMIERINSAGVLVDPTIITPLLEPPMIRFISDSVVEFYNEKRQKIYRKVYQDAEKQTVDFYCGDKNIPYALPADTNDFYKQNKYEPENSFNQKTGSITRLILEHDENGYLVKKMFRHGGIGGKYKDGILVKDEKGRWGLGYDVDNLGRIISIYNMDINGLPIDIRGVYVTCFDYGNKPYSIKAINKDKSGKLVLDERGVAFDVIDYDENLNVERISFYDANEKRTLNTGQVSVGVYTHDAENGFLISESYFDTNLEPCCNTEGWFRARFVRDKHGRVINWSCYDVNDEKTICSNGFASSVITYDNDGRTLSEFFFDTENKSAIISNAKVYGFKYSYKDGFIQKVDYIDSEGKLMLNSNGYASAIYEYDKRENKRSGITFMDTKGKKVMTSDGYAERRVTYIDGNIDSDIHYDVKGKTIADKWGIAKYTYVWEDGKLISEKYFDTADKLTLCPRGYARVDHEYDENGLKIWDRFYSDDDKRVIIIDGYSAVKYVYDNRGNQISESYYDIDDNKIMIKIEEYNVYCNEKKFEYDDKGNIIHVQYEIEKNNLYQNILKQQVRDIYREYDSRRNERKLYWLNGHGEEVDYKGNLNGIVKIEMEYDIHGRKNKTLFYKHGEEQPSVFQENKYDQFGRKISVRTILNGKLLMTEKKEYDDYGNLFRIYYLNRENKLFIPIDKNYAIKKSQYDIWGHETDTFYYDAEGKPMHQYNQAFHIKKTYDSKGNVLTESYYNDENANEPIAINGMLHIQPDSYLEFHKKITKYNALGHEIEIQLCDIDENVIMKIISTYDIDGKIINSSSILYESNGTKKEEASIEYDSKGNKINNVKIKYDENGNVIKELNDKISFDILKNLHYNKVKKFINFIWTVFQ